MKFILAAAAFLSTILLANYVTTEYGMVPVGFGLVATAGTYLAGLAFVLRDAVQDTAGKWATAGLIVAGAGLSYFVSDPFIALASGVAFAVSELADFAVYTPLRRHGYIRAAVASNVVGAVVDTLLFLHIAGFPVADAFKGQMVGKVAVTAAVVALVVAVRFGRRPKSTGIPPVQIGRIHEVLATGPVWHAGDIATVPVACQAKGCGWTHEPEIRSTVAEAESRMTALHAAARAGALR